VTGVNTPFNGLLNTPGFDRLDFSAPKAVIRGGAAVQKSVAERWHRVTGCYLTEGYGLTEASPVACANPIGTPWNGTIGIPYPSADLSIRDDAFNELPAWTGNGDLGHLDARGYFTVTDRKKDMILVSGFSVYPNEIESVVAMHPGVLECGVVGVPDAKSGESVKVVIVRKDPNLTQAAVIAHCKVHLTGYELPHQVELRAAQNQ
jgi:long-chain acyl-CoA synthetase